MGRFYHVLKRNENSETVHHAIWVDTETKQIDFAVGTKQEHHRDKDGAVTVSPVVKVGEVRHVLWFGWACYKRRTRHGKWSHGEWFRFSTPLEFWQWADSHCRARTKLWVFAHNTNFDLPVLDTFKMLPQLGYELTSAIIDGPPTVLKYEQRPKTIAIVDTLNIWRTSLADLGEHVGKPKLAMPVGLPEGDEWDTYCKNDVEVMMHACIEWFDFLVRKDLGGFTPTLASQAMRCFRHKYMKHPILIDNHRAALKVARGSYHGGRTEAFYIGGPLRNVYCLDVNSMYPYVMFEHEMPYRLIDYRERLTVHDLKAYLSRGAVCADVELETTEAFAPLVQNNKLTFPTGTFRACLTSPELAYALQNQKILRVHRLAVYEQAVLFREMVGDIYTDRLDSQAKGDKVQAWMFKILLNSFYGKWGQNGRKWRTIGESEAEFPIVEPLIDMDSLEVTQVRHFGGLHQVLEREDESAESHPAIAAHITAYARMHLFALMGKLPRKEYFYCDTDSLYVSEHGFNLLRDQIDPVALGKLKLVDHYEEVFIYGAKDLVRDGVETLKGIRKSADRIDRDTYAQEKWSSLKGILRDGRLNLPSTSRILKHLRRDYDKGVVGADGFVTPLHLDGLGV